MSKECFECGRSPVEMHHVVPRSLGGTKTVPLCWKCHSLVHSLKRNMDHSELTRKGIDAKRKRVAEGKDKPYFQGRKKGFVHPEETKRKISASMLTIRDTDRDMIILARELRASGMPYQKVADILMARGFTSPMGGKIYPNQVPRIIERTDQD